MEGLHQFYKDMTDIWGEDCVLQAAKKYGFDDIVLFTPNSRADITDSSSITELLLQGIDFVLHGLTAYGDDKISEFFERAGMDEKSIRELLG